jgi:pyruvate/2-oxoglutarate dehydrogenase complex dihydrolipoamide acyltransferase (E2) component
MATSAANLQLILEICAKTANCDIEDLKKAVAAKKLLPKKLLEPPKPKKEDSPFASTAAAKFAEEHSVEIKGLKGTSIKGKLTVKDLKDSVAGPKKVTVTAGAKTFAEANGVDLSKVVPAKEGKILKQDVVEYLREQDSDDSDSEPDFKLTTAAAREVDKYDIDDEDLEKIKGTGKDGAIKLCDLKELIDEIKAEMD